MMLAQYKYFSMSSITNTIPLSLIIEGFNVSSLMYSITIPPFSELEGFDASNLMSY
jgi:hypothetical protein